MKSLYVYAFVTRLLRQGYPTFLKEGTNSAVDKVPADAGFPYYDYSRCKLSSTSPRMVTFDRQAGFPIIQKRDFGLHRKVFVVEPFRLALGSSCALVALFCLFVFPIFLSLVSFHPIFVRFAVFGLNLAN